MGINCALDGPGGAGKSTVARAAAKKLGFIYVDTGALYRAIGLHAARLEKDTKSAADIVPLLDEIKVELKYTGGEQAVFLNGEDVSKLIRTNEISMAASNVSAVPEVREFLLKLQRDIASRNNVVMDGRDIGTVILPKAEVKIYMTASAEIRAERRYKELLSKGMNADYDEVLKEINQRDYNDMHRETAPLKQAEDAVYLDTSNMSAEEAADEVVRIIKEKTAREKPARRKMPKIRLFFYGILRAVVSVIIQFIVSVKYEGTENIPKEGGYIVAPNHMLWLDPVAVAIKNRNISAYIAKESIFESKIAALLLKPFHAFPVKRGQGDRGALNKAVEYLNLGYNLTIFPEGTRSRDGKLGKGKSGVAFISSAAMADVLPVGITVKGEKWRKKSP